MCNAQGLEDVCASKRSLQNINSGSAAQISNHISALLVAGILSYGENFFF